MTRIDRSLTPQTRISARRVVMTMTMTALIALVFISPTVSRAQYEAIAAPAMPAQGFWLEVVNATPEWLVVQNAAGQQFPLSIQVLDRGFMIRQPIAPQEIPLGAIAEVLGYEGQNGDVITDHIDFYEGALAQNAVMTSQLILGNGQVTNEFSISYNLANGFLFPLLGDANALPTRRQVVAPVINIQPLQLARPGNRTHTVVPSAGGILMTRLAFQSGTFANIFPGDLVFMTPSRAAPYTARSIIPAQMVVYRGFR